MDNDTYDDRIPRMNDQMNMRFIKLEAQFLSLSEAFEDYKHKMELKLERIDDILVVQRNQENMEKNKQCEWCGADLKLQPGPIHKEGGKAYCNPTCAASYRVTQEPRTKELTGG